MHRAAALCGLLALTACGPALGAEIDSITGRSDELEDAGQELDGLLSAWLRRGIERANRDTDVCNEAALYRGIRREIVSPFVGHFVAEALNANEALPSRRILMEESVYRDLALLDAISVHIKDLSAVVRVGDALIGVDKLGHFLVEGWQYFEIAALDEDGTGAAMDWGERAERTYFGLYTTGVRSQADLVANFEGLRFWSNVLGAAPDPLGKRRLLWRAYVRCDRGWSHLGRRRWRLRHAPQISEYINPAWDEAVNCSSYRTPEIERRVQARIRERGLADGVDYTCPIEADACAKARARYGEYAERLLHPDCLHAESRVRPWWRFW
jgi:hypothetical protein